MRLESFKEKLFYQWPAKILSLVAAILLYIFISLFGLERFEILVPIDYSYPGNLVTTKLGTQKVILHFKGSKDKIAYLKSLNLGPEDFSATVEVPADAKSGSIVLPIHTRLTTGGRDLRDLGYESSEPGDVELTLDQASYKKVKVVPVITGKPRSGFDVSNYSVIPTDITVKGSAHQLSLIDSIETEAVSIDGRDQTLTQNVRIASKNRTVTAVDSGGIFLRVEIKPTLETLVYNDLPIEVINLPPGLRIENKLPTGIVKLRDIGGSIDNNPIIVNKPKAAPRLYVIASKVDKPGLYSLSVIIDSDPRFELIDRNPKNVEVTVVANE